MSHVELGLEGVWLIFSVAMLGVAYFAIYRRARLECYQQDLFFLRNRLWDYMRERKMLDLPAHRAVRNDINALIRAAPVSNLFVVVLLVYIGARRGTRKAGATRDLIAAVPDSETRAYLAKVREQANVRLIWHLFMATFPGCLIGWSIFGYVIFTMFVSRCGKIAIKGISIPHNTMQKATFRLGKALDAETIGNRAIELGVGTRTEAVTGREPASCF